MLKSLTVIIFVCSLLCACDSSSNTNESKKVAAIKTVNYDNVQTCNEGIASLNPSSGEFQRIKKLLGREGSKSTTGAIIGNGTIEVEMIDEEGRFAQNVLYPVNEFITTCDLKFDQSVLSSSEKSTPPVAPNDIVIVEAKNANFWSVGYPNYVVGRVIKASKNTINYKMLLAGKDNKNAYEAKGKRVSEGSENQSDVFEGDDWYLPTPALSEKIKNLN